MTTLVECPQSRAGEWNFSLFGVPVCVKLWFWVTILILGGEREPGGVAIWIAVCFFSILLHELGHVFAFRFYGDKAEVVLYAWGGLAMPRRGVDGTLPRFVVALAGPAAGFVVTALTLAAARASGAIIHLGWFMVLPSLAVWPNPMAAGFEMSSLTMHWYTLLNDLLFVNFYWGLVNLLPVHPLDGGHAARAIFEQHDPYRGWRHALILSASVAGAVAIYGMMSRNLYLALMFGILAVSSLQMLESQRGAGGRPYRSWR